MHLSIKLIFHEQSQMTTKAGQAPPIGSSHLGISGGTCHSSGSAPRSGGLRSRGAEPFLGAGLGQEEKEAPRAQFSLEDSELCCLYHRMVQIFYLLLHLYSKGEFSLIFQSTIICIFALGCHWTVPETCTSTELLPDDGFMSSSKHPITNPISCTCIFSPYFVLLRTALPSYVTYIACRYQCNSLGSAASRQFP